MSVKTYLSIIIFLLSTMIIIFFITVDYRATVRDTEYKKTLIEQEAKALEKAKADLEKAERKLERYIRYRDDNNNINFIIINGDTIQIK